MNTAAKPVCLCLRSLCEFTNIIPSIIGERIQFVFKGKRVKGQSLSRHDSLI